MKKLLVIIMVLIFIDIYAKNVEYNKDGSITVTANGKKTKVNMDGKTLFGTDIETVTWVVSEENPVITFVYSAEFSDDDLSPRIRTIMTNTSTLLLREIGKNEAKLTDLKLVFSVCRFSRVGYCKRKGSPEFAITFFKGNKKYAELSVPYRDTVKDESENTLPTLIVRKALGK